MAIVLLLGGVARADPSPAPAPPKFSHAAHAKLKGLEALPCAQCHKLADKTYAPIVPGADAHKPCSNPGCHGARLASTPSTGPLCGECHERASRSGASEARLVHRSDDDRELGWRINHRRHLAVPGLATCDTCHQLTKVGEDDSLRVLVHSPGHADCAPCHGKSGSNPSLTQCSSCHTAGAVPRPKTHGGELSRWRVYEKFDHEKHRLDIRTAKLKVGGMGRGWSRWDAQSAMTLGCGACHESAAHSESIQDMDLLGPCAMSKTCMGQCHNGKFAFQGSGTNMRDCLLCHTGVDDNTPAPASHCGM